MATLVNIIGEQPIPNMLPNLYLNPDKNIFLFTDTTEKIAARLNKLVLNSKIIRVYSYDYNSFSQKLEEVLAENENYIFNITGGTKIMSIALFNYAKKIRSQVVYLQSEETRTKLFFYDFSDDGLINISSKIIPELMDIDLFLKIHLPGYEVNTNFDKHDSGFKYENAIVKALQKNDFEVLPSVKPRGEGNQLEIDAVIRLKGTNKFGIAEIKIGDKREEGPKKGIDQLALAGSREYLGTYTKRFLITERILSKHIKELALAHNIVVVDDIKTNPNTSLLELDSKNKLIERLKEKMQ